MLISEEITRRFVHERTESRQVATRWILTPSVATAKLELEQEKAKQERIDCRQKGPSKGPSRLTTSWKARGRGGPTVWSFPSSCFEAGWGRKRGSTCTGGELLGAGKMEDTTLSSRVAGPIHSSGEV